MDEVHTSHYAGEGHYGIPPFRRSWGRLKEIKSLFPTGAIPWLAMTATCPPHVQKTIDQQGFLRPGYVTLRTTVNRPNTIYAMHEVPGTLDDIENYACFVRKENPESQPRVLIFFDKKSQAKKIAQGMLQYLPTELRDKGIIRHYHSKMSKKYLTKMHKSFTDLDGSCRILCSTSIEATVCNFIFLSTLADPSIGC